MTRSSEPWVLGAIALGALALVGLGIASVGGPSAGRAERNDKARLADLRILTAYVDCISGKSPWELPETLPASDKLCGTNAPLTDRHRLTVEPYVYRRISPVSYQLCAKFERPEVLDVQRYYWGNNSSFEPTTGCLTVYGR